MAAEEKYPLISVIVPVYNAEKYIERGVRSLMNQTYKNLEIILVDDGSKDASLEICNHLAEEDTRIIVIHKENGGVSSARNAGLDIAKGEFIGFMDNDDLCHPQMYSALYETIINGGGHDVACCLIQIFNDDDNISFAANNLEAKSILTQSEVLSYMFDDRFTYDTRMCWNMIWNKLWRKSIIGNSRFINICSEDMTFNLEQYLKSKSFVLINAPLYYNMQRLSSLSRANNMTYYQTLVESRWNFYKIVQKVKEDQLRKKYEALALVKTLADSSGIILRKSEGSIREKLIGDVREIRWKLLKALLLNKYVPLKHKLLAPIRLFMPITFNRISSLIKGK